MTISRRAVLRGFGTLVALPWLEGLEARAQAPAPRRRFLAYQTPNGVNLKAWSGATGPAAPAAFTTLAQSPTLAPLGAAHGAYVTQLNGLSIRHVGPTGHHHAVSGWLTDATCMNGALRLCINPPSAADLTCAPEGISLDQLLATRLPRQTRFRSLELGPYFPIDASDQVCGDMACPYLFNVSWANGSTPMGRERDVALAFDRIFAGTDPAQSAVARQRRLAQRLRVADFVRDDTARLLSRLGRDDRRRLDQYLSAVADLEDDLRASGLAASCAPGARPQPVTDPFVDPREYLAAFRRVMVLALQCDLTRIITFMASYSGHPGYRHDRSILTGNGPGPGGAWEYPDGTPSIVGQQAHHELSHWSSNNLIDTPNLQWFQHAKLHGLAMIDRFYVSELSALLAELRAVDDGAGQNLLDNTLVLYGADMSDPDQHSTLSLPLLLAGGSGVGLRGKGVLQLAGPAAALHLAIAQQLGVTVPRFGNDGTAPLAGVFD